MRTNISNSLSGNRCASSGILIRASLGRVTQLIRGAGNRGFRLHNVGKPHTPIRNGGMCRTVTLARARNAAPAFSRALVGGPRDNSLQVEEYVYHKAYLPTYSQAMLFPLLEECRTRGSVPDLDVEAPKPNQLNSRSISKAGSRTCDGTASDPPLHPPPKRAASCAENNWWTRSIVLLEPLSDVTPEQYR